MSHGGKRKGAGRPQGSGEGRKALTKSITLHFDLWQKLDDLRGNESASAYLAKKIKGMRSNPTNENF